MAFFESYTGEEHPGDWEGFGEDKDRNLQVLFRIRPESQPLREQLDREFAKPKSVRGGIKMYVIPRKLEERANVVHAGRLWTDTKNCWIRVKTEAALALYRQELSLNGEAKVGDEVCVDGKLTTKLKEDILTSNMKLTLAILAKARLLEAEEVRDEEGLEKN